MTETAKALLGFGVAAGALVILADYSPKLALVTTGVLVLGVALSHSQDITTLFNAFTAATGH